MIKEFRSFIMRGNVVDMAVGVIIGAAFGKIVTSMVSDILMPPLGVLIGGLDFSDLAITLKGASAEGTAPVVLRYGLFINNVINFLIMAFCIFLLVKGVNALKKNPPPADPTEKKCPQCMMLIPIPAKKCGYCTSTL